MARQRGVSRAQMVREAIARYLEVAVPGDPGAAFGIWRGRDADGLKYERPLRKAENLNEVAILVRC